MGLDTPGDRYNARYHKKGIPGFDIALSKLLFADDFSMRLIDFANSAPVSEYKGRRLCGCGRLHG
jgi:hypothetical protein